MGYLELNLLKQEIEVIGERIDAYKYEDLDGFFNDFKAYQDKWEEYNNEYKKVNR